MTKVLPYQAFLIVVTEACERFSYYGMLSILTLYLNRELGFGESGAQERVHLFKMAVYFLPLVGGWLADRWLGRYATILSLSLFYCLGHGVLALAEGSASGLYLGLLLIALGAGGIKPCVSAFVGDQFGEGARSQLPLIYGLFYAAINFGAFFAFALIPVVREHWGYRWAFGIPGLFMGLATLVFWAGSRHYVRVPPSASAAPVVVPGSGSSGRQLGRIALMLSPVIVFWSLYDQINTSWVIQGTRLASFDLWGYKVDAERMQSVSALLVLFWVPVLAGVVYPALRRLGFATTPLRRMGWGMVAAAAAFGICAWLQHRVDSGERLSLAWQLPQYVVLELGEVLVSATGLEFAYSQAPRQLRSTVMSLWLLTTALGNLLVAVLTHLRQSFFKLAGLKSVAPDSVSAVEFLFYAGLMLVVVAGFAVLAVRYRPVETAPVRTV